eukprot:5498900-Amphidinium_carterae.1
MSLAEVFLATLWLVMGALFVTSITSPLAATLIDAHEKQQDRGDNPAFTQVLQVLHHVAMVFQTPSLVGVLAILPLM